MKIRLSNAAKGYGFDQLTRFEMNNFDVEEVLPPLFYLIVTSGRLRARCPNDPSDIDGYVKALAAHSHLAGFESPRARQLLQRWVRTSLIETARQGRSRSGEQVAYIVPLSLLAYKAGMPSQMSRLRKVHTFVYDALKSCLEEVGGTAFADRVLRAMFREAFGKGVSESRIPPYDAHFDGAAGLDLSTLLSLYFLDGFRATDIAAAQRTPAADREANRGPALPRAFEAMARSILAYMSAYAGALPVLALSRGLGALINFHLLIYSLKLVYAANELLEKQALPAEMRGESATAPCLYVDFTRRQGSDSERLARWCVTRDLEELRSYFKTAVTLRSIDRYASGNESLKNTLRGVGDAPSYLLALSKLRADVKIEARAEAETETIVDDTKAAMSQSESEEFDLWFAEEKRVANGSLDVAIRLLLAAQAKNGVEAYMKWFMNVGGIRKPYGFLSGSRRDTASYAMSDDLLAALVHVAMTEFRDDKAQAFALPRIRLSDFIAYLREEFGILIDSPPQIMDNAGTRAAAAENLEAFKRRLRQMGYFQALSDDFTAQYLKATIGEVPA